MTSELHEKMQKFIKILIEDMDAEHLGSVMADVGLKGWELDMFLSFNCNLDEDTRDAYEAFAEEMETKYNMSYKNEARQASIKRLLKQAKALTW